MRYIVVRLFSLAGDSDLDGMYLHSFDPSAAEGRGAVMVTPDRNRAARFATMEEIFRLYRATPACHPTRDDGKPNRPLSAFHLTTETVDVPDAVH